MKSIVSILVVEDEPDQRELICDILSVSNFKVMSADCVEQAILMLKKNCYDVIFSDWKLGELSGLDLLNYVRRNDVTDTQAYSPFRMILMSLKNDSDILCFFFKTIS